MKSRLSDNPLARIGFLVLLAAFAGPCFGQIVLTPRNPNGLYRPGEKVVWTVTAGSESDKTKAEYSIRKNGADEVLKQGTIDLSSGSATIESSLGEPGALLLEVTPPATDAAAASSVAFGSAVKAADKVRDGAIVDAGKIKPCLPRPADFESWWAKKLAELRTVPMNPKLEKTEVGVPGVEYFKVTLDSIKGTHVRGQLARPAKPGKFPAILQFQYAGVYPLPHQWVTERAKAGWLAFNVPSHDQPIDDAAEIKRLADGPLKDYAALGNTDRETCYFLQMYLRDCRALEYLASRPDWDGKTLVVTGDSMGGQQTIATVGLMNGRLKISAMIVHVPSGGDVGARSKGRPMAYPGWWGPPEVANTAPYFDPANFAPRIKAASLVSLGLFDGIAPPTTILSSFNLLAGPKELLPLHSDHGGPGQQPRDARREEWLAALAQGKPAPVNMRGEPKPSPPAISQPAPGHADKLPATVPETKTAPIHIPRGRPHLNSMRTTFVADNGQLLRGPYESTEWTGAAPYENVARMKTLGFNAVHLYGEAFDTRYPNPGSTAPGGKVEEVDKFVKMTRELGLYLVLTIGNGAANGKYNKPWILGFWKFYAARYARETHVLFEVQNEPVAWGPPYGNPKATPPGAIDMEVEAYKTIRAVAPESPVLLFSYSVLGGNGGKEALKDIAAFNAGVGGDPRQIWSNAAVAFHGYAGHASVPVAVADLLAAGYPCFMTEFISSDWGGTDGQDIELTAELERLGVSWLNFLTIPPIGVSPDVTIPEVFKKRIELTGLSWTPDFGNWPVKRGVFGNDGQPRATPGTWEKDQLKGAFRLEFEDFDTGGQDVAYHDKSERVNEGRVYRPNEGVDIWPIADGGAGLAVRADDGEWLEYTILVKEPGAYQLSLRYASARPGALRLLLGGREFARIPMEGTGGPTSWKTLTHPVFLEYGRKILHVEIPKGGCDLNWLELAPVKNGPIPDGIYKILNRASGLAMTNQTAPDRRGVEQAPFEDKKTQLWKLEHLGAGQYRVSSIEDKCYWAAGLEPGVGLVWWGGENTAGHQRFVIRANGDGFCRIAPVAGGHDLGVKDASTQSGATMQRHPYKGGPDQQWAIQKPDATALPTGVVAGRVSPSQVNVSWEPVPGATGYLVKRANTSGGPYASVRVPPAQKGFADRNAAKGKDYFYVVSAVGKGGESLNSAEVTPGVLRAHLKFDETSGGTASDDTGNKWDGTLVGGQKRVPGRAGNALAFDGEDDHVTLPEGIVSGLGDFSISAWVNLDASKPWARIFDFGRGPGACMFLTPCGGSANTLRFAISAGSGEQVIEGSKPVPTGKWAHVAVVLKGGVGTLYLDGEEVGRKAPITLTPDALGKTTQNYLGKSQFPDPYLAGKIDDFRIYAGALSPGEIAAQAKSPPF
jgi:endoglucanase